jgi:hypothetical protein
MEELISFCGIGCHECEAFKATQNDDDKKRAKVAKQWSKQHNTIFEPHEINCDGCKSQTGRLFKYCRTCDVRKCGIEKEIETCSHCPEYACEKLNPIFKVVPGAEVRLDALRKN